MAGDGILSSVMDGFSNFAARLGLNQNNISSASSYDRGTATNNRTALENAYETSWVVARGVDIYAEDMTRAGIDIHTSLPPDKLDRIYKSLRDNMFWDSTRRAIAWSRLYGGSIMVALIDGQDVATPLNIDSIRKGQFKGFTVFDRWMLHPSFSDVVQDFGPDLGLPTYYEVLAGSPVFAGKRIHHSRIARLNGVDLPFQRSQAQNGWGLSVVERLHSRVIAYDSATTGMSQLIYKAHLRTMKMKGYRTAVAMGGDGLKGVLASLDMIRLMQNNEGLTVLDKDDEFEAHSYTFAGLPDALDKLAEQVSASLQIPIVRMFGQSPKGFSTGETDLRNHYDAVNMNQEARLRRPVRFGLDLACQSEFGFPMPEGSDFSFTPLWQMSAKEKADIASEVTDAVAKVFDNGIIGRKSALQELRALAPITGAFSNITDEDINNAEPDPPDPSEALIDRDTDVNELDGNEKNSRLVSGEDENDKPVVKS